MAVHVRERGLLGGGTRHVPRRIGIEGVRIVTGLLVLGAVVGSLGYALSAAKTDGLGVQEIQQARAAATVEAYDRAWLSAGSVGVETPAGLEQARAAATVDAYERQWASAHRAEAEIQVTGTGPGLVTIAEEQQAAEG